MAEGDGIFEIGVKELYDLLVIESAFYEDLEPRDIMVWHTHPAGLVGPSEGDMRLKNRLASQGLSFRWCVVTLGDPEAMSDTGAIATEY